MPRQSKPVPRGRVTVIVPCAHLKQLPPCRPARNHAFRNAQIMRYALTTRRQRCGAPRLQRLATTRLVRGAPLANPSSTDGPENRQLSRTEMFLKRAVMFPVAIKSAQMIRNPPSRNAQLREQPIQCHGASTATVEEAGTPLITGQRGAGGSCDNAPFSTAQTVIQRPVKKTFAHIAPVAGGRGASMSDASATAICSIDIPLHRELPVRSARS